MGNLNCSIISEQSILLGFSSERKQIYCLFLVYILMVVYAEHFNIGGVIALQIRSLCLTDYLLESAS